MKKSQDKLSEILKVDFIPEQELQKIVIVPTIIEEPKNEVLQTDFLIARNNIKNLIKSGTESLAEIAKIAKDNNEPRAYEIVATLLKTLTEMNKTSIDLHDILSKAESKKVSIKNTTNNSIYVGSTSDLQNLINQERSPLKVVREEED